MFKLIQKIYDYIKFRMYIRKKIKQDSADPYIYK